MNEGVFFLQNELSLLNSMLSGDCDFQKYSEGGDYFEIWNSLLGVRDGESFLSKVSFHKNDEENFEKTEGNSHPEVTKECGIITVRINDSGPELSEARAMAISMSRKSWKVSEADSIDNDFVDIIDQSGDRVARVYSTGSEQNPIINAANIVNAQNNISVLIEKAEYYKHKLYNDLHIIKEKLEEASGNKIEIIKNDQPNRADL
jgi:hypothetical protein